MTDEQTQAIAELRDAGYAVAVFKPEELGSADSSKVEDRMVEVGWDVIASLAG